MKHFFISYTQSDRKKAEWIAWHLEKAGYSVVIQAWDFKQGQNFVNNMDVAMNDTRRTLCVLSPEYLNSKFTKPEWMAAFTRDPTNQAGTLVPVRVKPIKNFQGVLAAFAYIDLVGLEEDQAPARLLAGIREACPADPNEPPLLPPQERPNLAEPSWDEAFGKASAIASGALWAVGRALVLALLLAVGLHVFLGNQLPAMRDDSPEVLTGLSVLAAVMLTAVFETGWWLLGKLRHARN